MGTELTGEEFNRLFDPSDGFAHTAFRLELQPVYLEPDEYDTVAKFLAGEPEPPDRVFPSWFEQIADMTAQGKRIERVRVQEDPPTDYQRWERWAGRWNIDAGEVIRYMTRQRAHEIGLLPAAGDIDWWLFDSRRLVRMYFDEHGHRIRTKLVTDPATVVQACAWRDLAVHYSVADAGNIGQEETISSASSKTG